MQTKIKATGINLSEEIEKYLETRLEAIGKIIDLENPTLLVEVELGKVSEHHQTGDVFRAELNLSIDGEQFRAVSQSADLNSAIDKMRDEILNTLRSYKSKRQSLIKRGGAKIKNWLKKFYK